MTMNIVTPDKKLICLARCRPYFGCKYLTRILPLNISPVAIKSHTTIALIIILGLSSVKAEDIIDGYMLRRTKTSILDNLKFVKT